MKKDPFKNYTKQSEPSKQKKANYWKTAIGLQAVDGLQVSDYLIEKAILNIEGYLTIEEVSQLIHDYYIQNPKTDFENRDEEADKVSTRIAELISNKTFDFSTQEYLFIHKYLFQDIYEHAGQIRTYNITKKEWILDEDSVTYGNSLRLLESLEYDIFEERKFNYQNFSKDQIIDHLSFFISNLWQNHVFCEGNTRTTAVFFIKYLNVLGYDVTNDLFEKNSWYFRNALVRANYTNLKKGIVKTNIFLEKFLRNLLFGETNELNNRAMHIKFDLKQAKKPDIDIKKPDIDTKKPDIDSQVELINLKIPEITLNQIRLIYNHLGLKTVFGRSDIQNLTGVKSSRASDIIKTMLDHKIIYPVRGYGKGKYIFYELI